MPAGTTMKESEQNQTKHVYTQPFKDQCSHHTETSELICRANQLTGVYMMGTLVVKGLNF